MAFYLSQLVGVSFFNHTGELRFAAFPGLLLVGSSIFAAAAIVVKSTPGSRRRKGLVALLMPVPYALIAGLGALLVPLHATAAGFAQATSVDFSASEAFLLPLACALLFSSLGGLVGMFGRDWLRGGSRLLGEWAVPLGSSLRVLAVSLAIATVLTIAGGLALAGDRIDSLEAAIGGLLVLPTLVATVLLGSFGVSVDWSADALSHSQGSLAGISAGLPGADLLPLLGLATVLAVGWLTARRSGEVKLSLTNSVRAGAILAIAIWVVGLLARVDAQAGGLLGVHFAPDATSLLWHVPLLSFLGCFAGASAQVCARGAQARRQLLDVLVQALFAPPSASTPRWLDPARQGVTRRASAGLAFAAVPLAVVAMGPAGSSAPEPEQVSYAPIMKEAEGELEADSTSPGAVKVTVNSATRAIGTASARIPVKAVGAAAGDPPAEKARAVLAEYGDLFGLSSRPAELGRAHSTTDQLGMTHVSFEQMAAGVPVFGGEISVHFSADGKYVDFISASTVPDVFVADTALEIDKAAALDRAKAALPGGELVREPTLGVYAGSGPIVSGPNARLAWLVWLVDTPHATSSVYAIDAVSGKVLQVIDKSTEARNRLVYNANHTFTLPGTLARSEGQAATGDTDVDNAYTFSGDTYDFYWTEFGRDSYNGKGATLKSTAHYGTNYANAFWNGVQMVYGDGYASARDVVGHELTHAVTEYSAGLVYSGQSGALNEGFSDIMGESVEWFKKGSADWIMGAALPGGAIRSLKEPNEYIVLGQPSPKHLSEWYTGCADNFGVHVNSTIFGHAYYLLATNIGVEASAKIFYRTLTVYLRPNSTMEDARNSAIQSAADLYGGGSTQYNQTVSAFNAVGLNGTAQPPPSSCSPTPGCSFAVAIESAAAGAEEGPSTASMLSTLYKARGELALGSAAGNHFLPLYEQHMGRITELVSQDPALAEMSVRGLEEITPALEALMNGEGEKFTLTPAQMKKIEVALKRLAQDDRMYGGPDAGELAELIDEELEWLALPSYGGMDYEAGFERLNTETEANTLSETGEVVEPLCDESVYSNNFAVNNFSVDTQGRRIPGQVSGLSSHGVACGTVVQATGSWSTCTGKETLNTQISVQLPPGDKVNSTKNLSNGSWVGKASGNAIACAGEESKVITGPAALRSLSSWSSSQCPTTAVACYEGRAKYEERIGYAYAYVTESGGVSTLTMTPIQVTVEGTQVPVGFGEFGVELCARAGAPGTTECGGSSGTWIHQNGESSEAGCANGKGLYSVTAKNGAGQSTQPARSCVRWENEARMQTIDAPNSLNAVSCIPSSTTCVASDSKGNAFYATNVSATAAATWNSWTGPGASPSYALSCPATTLCLIAAGEVSGGGGNVYKATSLGGAFSTSFLPANGVGSVSCPTTTFCVTAQEGGGFIRYSTNPSGISWTARVIGSGAMKGVTCLSVSFCAVVDDTGNVRVATTEARVKEATGYAATNVNGTKALTGISCSSTTNCLAIDGGKEVLKLTIAQPAGTATVSKVVVPGAGELTSVTCTGATCVAVDALGGIFTSENSGTSWTRRHEAGEKLKSVSCASATLCASVNVSGDVAMFKP
ncbi:MAG TPA: M4 family metallopeptidase [Solirubrobacterales bacterium]|nr:M4 family metallopeptidase [Solirubrobacterales bacterium]